MTDPASPMPPEQTTTAAAEPADASPPPQPEPEPQTEPEPELRPQPQPSPARSAVRTWAVGGAALVVALAIGIGGAVTATSGDRAQPANATAPSTPTTPTTATPTTAALTTAAPTIAAPTPTKSTAAPKPKPPTYKKLSARQWKLIAKNPDAHLGEHYVVYGRVTQFDAATGTDSFRADVAHRRMSDSYDYETNTMLYGSESELEDLVEDDIFRATVMVLGSHSYDTQVGGSTTAPLLQVDSFKVL
ncbi:hypothetical protein [Micromonospora sp. DT233]|uniref:hypothetical protein n=1 Tax=Micromonospora sp. DT233 TaxID=3393432 RepID=UPI003CEED319